ncbi:amidohydrolase family protein [Variovorax guangxiensis]|uniref:dihydroorotase n=1 Tax=Variovorax guangxiensis TaxID=1775474 RepID=UPI00285BD4B9|nr:amidohydrolase family protein [Variovorax guangxiensis]MDR6861368.1 dihydropyrimidinase [Variovorax guangxiensis]
MSQADLVIRNARVVRHDGEFHGGVAVKDGKIIMTGANSALPKGHREIDAGGRVLMPGVIDPHCHLGVKYPYAEDMRTETAAAASGGVTTALLYIRNLKPSYLPFYEERKAVGEENSIIDFGFHFGIQREEHIAEIPEIVAKTGVRSFKCYFGYEPDNPIGIVPATDGWVYAAMRILAKIPGGLINVHCENTQIASWLKNEIKATGRQDLGAYTESRPAFCEVETIRRMIFLAERTGCSLHLVHTSVGMGPVLAAEAQARGVHVTVETCQHYLTRTAYDSDLDMRAKISPPLRDKEEQEGLWRGVLNGSVYSLGTDHVPFLPKKLEDLWSELPGVVSFPWELSLMLHFGVHQRGLPLSRLVQLNSANPARRFGLWPRKGNIEVGFDADMVLVDLDEERTVEHTGKGTCIYEGWKLKGWPVLTVARGAVLYENGAVDESQFGRGRCLSVPA